MTASTFSTPLSASPAWTKISTATASSSATISFTGLSNTYLTYMVEITDMVVATNASNLYFQFGTGATPTYQTSAYYGSKSGAYSSSGALVSTFSNAAQATINDTNAGASLTTTSGATFNGNFYIYNPSQATTNHYANWQGSYQGSGAEAIQVVGGAEWRGTTAVTAIKFYMSSGNIASGTFTLYGLNP